MRCTRSRSPPPSASAAPGRGRMCAGSTNCREPLAVGFQNAVTCLDLGFCAARWYSLMRPPRTGWRLICCWVGSPVGWPGRGGRGARLRWGRRRLQGRAYSAGTDRRCRSPGISIRSVTSVRAVSTNLSADAFAGGLRGGIVTASMPAPARAASNGRGELPGPVADQEPECRGRLTGVHQEVADLLQGPRPVRVRGDPGDVRAA
jgi:hypothetical protein